MQSKDGLLRTYSPVNVQYFIAQEQPSGRPYTFKSLDWDLGRDYSKFKKPTFSNKLNQGPVTLIMREDYYQKKPANVPLANNQYYDSRYYAQNPEWLAQIDELYYLLLPNSEIVTLRNVRKDLHKLFGKKSKSVKKYVKEHHLNYEKPHHLVAIVNYFNSLVAETAVNAMQTEN
ncbi:hypothetical protein GCM10028895_19480 [Pontibacter rugosus]